MNFPCSSVRLVRCKPVPAALTVTLLCAAAWPLAAPAQSPATSHPEAARRSVSDLEPRLTTREEVLPFPAQPAGASELPPAYSTYLDRWPPPPPTCTSCAAIRRDLCCQAAGPFRRLWHFRAKPALQESHWGYCNYFDEKPFGSALRQAIGIQVAQAAPGQMVLYQYDFLASDSPSPAELTDRGREQLARIVQRLAYAPLPVTVEQTPGQPQLDQARRAHVLHLLQHQGVPVAEHSVIIRPVRHGQSSAEAVQIYENMLQQTRRGW
jgi:hypothetical protein